MIRVGVCDDDDSILTDVSNVLKQISKKGSIPLQIQTFTSGEQLLFETEDNMNFSDILIMDIIMSKKNGIDTCKELRKRGFYGSIIFLSTSKNYAIDAYEVGAISYIMKQDLYSDKFKDAFTRAIELSQHEASHQLLIINNKTVHSIDLRKIIYFESNLKKVIAHEEYETHSFYGKFEDVVSAVVENDFIRCHKSYVVNSAYVKSFSPTEVVCSSNITLPMGRTHYAKFKELFFKYLKDAVQL